MLTQPVLGVLNYDGCITQLYNDQTTDASLLAFYKSLGLNGHDGIDFTGSRGTPIYAAHDGVVVYAYDTKGTGGKGLKIWNKDGYYTKYFHCDELLVSAGQIVSRGQICAKMGNSGSGIGIVMGVHLHFGLYECDAQGIAINMENGFKGAIDPLPFLLNNMEYIIIGKEQYLLYAPLKMALNIGDQNILAGLVLNGLAGSPTTKTSLPAGYKVYPLVDKLTLKDLFGL